MQITVLTLTRIFGNIHTPKIQINEVHEVESVKQLNDLYCIEYKCDDCLLEMTKQATEKELQEFTIKGELNPTPEQYKALKSMGIAFPTQKDVYKLNNKQR